MTWDMAILVFMTVGLAIYIVLLSFLAEEDKLRVTHFYILIVIVGAVLVQAVSV